MKLRSLAFKLHRYIGVMVGLLLLIIGLTGSALVFWHEIDYSQNLHLRSVIPQGERISLESAAKIVRSSYPNLQLSLIELPRKPEETYIVSMSSKDDKSIDVYVHPYTGKILGSGEWGRTLMTFIYNIHITLLAGEVGDFVVGICGILLLLLGLTGLILWTGWRRLATGFRIRWKSPTRLVNYDIHQVSGIVSSALLILMAFTGAAMIFYEQFESAVYAISNIPKPEEPKSTIVANRPRLAIDAVVQKANAPLPEGEITYITIPEKPDEAFMVAGKLPFGSDSIWSQCSLSRLL